MRHWSSWVGPRSRARAKPWLSEHYEHKDHPNFHPDSYASRVNARPGGRHWPAMTAAQEKRWSRIEGVGIAP